MHIHLLQWYYSACPINGLTPACCFVDPCLQLTQAQMLRVKTILKTLLAHSGLPSWAETPTHDPPVPPLFGQRRSRMPLNILHCQQPETWHSFCAGEHTGDRGSVFWERHGGYFYYYYYKHHRRFIVSRPLAHDVGKGSAHYDWRRCMIDRRVQTHIQPLSKKEIIFKSTYMRNSYSHELGKCVASTKWVRAP